MSSVPQLVQLGYATYDGVELSLGGIRGGSMYHPVRQLICSPLHVWNERNLMHPLMAPFTTACFTGTLALMCALPLGAEAKTLYINGATGNDAVSYATNSDSTPWRSIGRAAWGSTVRSAPNPSEAAQAGDTVRVAAGTYSTAGTDSRYDPAYNPANSGTAGNPITFQAEGTVVLRLSSSSGTVIGAYQRNYITWRGFSIDEANARSHPDTGSVTFWFSEGSSAEDLILDGNGDAGFGDNHPGIRIENSLSITIRNNLIRNYRTSGVNSVNGAGIQVYNSKGLTIEHNEIHNSGSGIFLKAIGFSGKQSDPAKYSDRQDVIRYNLIHNVAYGLVHHRHWHTAPTVYALWSQNIVRKASIGGIVLWGFPGDGPNNGRFINNTVYESQDGFYLLGSRLSKNANVLSMNNLIVSSTHHALFNEPPNGVESWDIDRLTLDRNWYYGYDAFAHDGKKWNLNSFRNTYPGQESNSVDGTDPEFINLTACDLRLRPESPARTGGRAIHGVGGSDNTTIPVGAYITGNETIGRQINSADRGSPAPSSKATCSTEPT